jgi:hypothetical protein
MRLTVPKLNPRNALRKTKRPRVANRHSTQPARTAPLGAIATASYASSSTLSRTCRQAESSRRTPANSTQKSHAGGKYHGQFCNCRFTEENLREYRDSRGSCTTQGGADVFCRYFLIGIDRLSRPARRLRPAKTENRRFSRRLSKSQRISRSRYDSVNAEC